MSNKGIANLDVKIFAVPLEGTASKLGPIVGDDPVWTPNLHMMDLMNFITDCLLILTTDVAFVHLVNLSMAM
jgi:hypothetical protein